MRVNDVSEAGADQEKALENLHDTPSLVLGMGLFKTYLTRFTTSMTLRLKKVSTSVTRFK